ncbi:MAG: hypothetical protein JEZ07_09615 [Phycisphaerae bacterium]|nr:hypothetical protein [Phycisphaerae bacterium]
MPCLFLASDESIGKYARRLVMMAARVAINAPATTGTLPPGTVACMLLFWDWNL